jgi:AcrR family transcriptional regulator
MTKTNAARADVLPVLAEVFRRHGFEGTSLALITAATGLGKGSLYHFFPGGKEQMAAEVLADIDRWFKQTVYDPLRKATDPGQGIADMFAAVDGYFQSGRRVCLVGVLALGGARDTFGDQVKAYFVGWIDALAAALRRCGEDKASARPKAEQVVLEIQGALVLARALDDPKVFMRALEQAKQRLKSKAST